MNKGGDDAEKFARTWVNSRIIDILIVKNVGWCPVQPPALWWGDLCRWYSSPDESMWQILQFYVQRFAKNGDVLQNELWVCLALLSEGGVNP